MAKEKTIKRIGVVIEGGNIIDTDTNGKTLKENTKYFCLDGIDYYFSTGATVYEAASEKRVHPLATNPNLVKMIARSDATHTFYVDDEIVSDEIAIATAEANVR